MLRAGQMAFCARAKKHTGTSPSLSLSLSLPESPYPRIVHCTMSGFDANRIISVPVHDAPPPQDIERPAEVERMLLDFLLEYRVGGEFIYRFVYLLHAMLSYLTLFSIVTNFVQISCSNSIFSKSTCSTSGFTMKN